MMDFPISEMDISDVAAMASGKSYPELLIRLSIQYNSGTSMSSALFRSIMNNITNIQQVQVALGFVNLLRFQTLAHPPTQETFQMYVEALANRMTGDLTSRLHLSSNFIDFVAELNSLFQMPCEGPDDEDILKAPSDLKSYLEQYLKEAEEWTTVLNNTVLERRESLLSTKGKLIRAVAVFEALLHLFETNLSEWTASNTDCPLTRINYPLIAAIVWHDQEFGTVNQHCSDVVDVFCTFPNSPGLNRYVSILAEVSRLIKRNSTEAESRSAFFNELFTKIQNSDSPFDRVKRLTLEWLKLDICADLLDWRLTSISPSFTSGDIVRIMARNLTQTPKSRSNKPNHEPRLHSFVRKGLHTNLKFLLVDPTVDINSREDGQTPLYTAVSKNDINAVLMIIENRLTCLVEGSSPLDINADSLGTTPLLKALELGNDDIVEVLLRNGAATSIFVKNREGVSPMSSCVIHHRARLLQEYKYALNTFTVLDIVPHLFPCLIQTIKSYLAVHCPFNGLPENSFFDNEDVRNFLVIKSIFERISTSDKTAKEYYSAIRRMLPF